MTRTQETQLILSPQYKEIANHNQRHWSMSFGRARILVNVIYSISNHHQDFDEDVNYRVKLI